MKRFVLIYYIVGGYEFRCTIEAEDKDAAGSIAEGLEVRIYGCKGYDLYDADEED